MRRRLDVVRKVRFDSAFTFIYSKRTGTPAAAMENQVPEDVVKNAFQPTVKGSSGSFLRKSVEEHAGHRSGLSW